MKLEILKVRFGLTALFVFNVLIFNIINAQSLPFCNVAPGTEPHPQTEMKSTANVAEIFSPHFTRWNQLTNLKFSDDKKASIVLTNINRSRQILGNNFKFQIPEGATINGITLMIEGQSDAFAMIDELQIQLMGTDGEPKGNNKKNEAKLQKAWSQNPDNKDKTWMYGSKSDLWGTQWTPEELNDPNFGFLLQIRNIVNDTVRVEIDQVLIIVDFTPAYSFCDDMCLTFHVDKFENYGSYVWDYPVGFQMVSSTTHNQTIDLKITTAAFGLYTICVDLYDYAGNYSHRCCRDFVYQDCNSSQIKGMAWLDLNDNQMRDGGEGILSNVPLVLFNENGVAVDTVLTDQFGKYVFANLIPGNYYIKAPTFSDRRLILQHPAVDPDTNSDVTNAFGPGTTDLITTEIGKTVEYIDFGYTPLVSVGDFVWYDLNYNGLQDVGESGVENIKVKIFRQNGTLYDSTYTDANGKYKFENIAGNRYYLTFDIPAGFYPTFINNTSITTNSKINDQGRTPLYIFTTPGYYKDVDAGLFKKATLGDLVWEDKNGDGLYDDNTEVGIAGVSITLTGTAGNGVSINRQTITDGNGRYLFDDVLPGLYTLGFTPPNGYHFTVPNQGDDTKDSDVIDGKIEDITITSGDFNLNFDAGLYRYGSIGDFVWNDMNGDGIQQNDEKGIADVVLHLFEYVNADTFYIGETQSDADGKYTFNDLKPGRYKVSVELPDGFEFTLPNVGNDNSDSDVVDGVIADIMLMSGENNTSYDVGMYNFGSIGDFVWEDINGNGIQDSNEPGISGVTIGLTGVTASGLNVAYVVLTDADGHYLFDQLEPGDYTIEANLPAGYTWTVSGLGNDRDLDADGVDGVLDITVGSGTKLFDIDFGMYRLSTIGDFVWEDSNGNGIQDTDEFGIEDVDVLLEGETGAGIAISISVTTDQNGFYSIQNIPPGNYTLTLVVPANYNLTVGTQGNDLAVDSDFADDNKVDLTITSGQSILTIDAGLVRSISIGDFVWHDKNANGLQDIAEIGIQGVIVALDGQTGTGTQVNQMTVTDASGYYSFDGLLPGAYSLVFTASGLYEFTLSNRDVNDVLDSDAINGIITNIVARSGDQLDNYDAGFVLRSSIGDFVWEDMNGNGIQDAGEPGIGNVIITLSGTDFFGDPVNTSTISDNNGNYSFDQLLPGVYDLQFDAGNDLTPTLSNQGNPLLDSDPVNGLVSGVVVISDDHKTDIDAGYYKAATIEGIIWEDKNANGMRETDEGGLENITLTISGSNGTMATVVTGSGGRFRFTNLAPATYTVQADLPFTYHWSVSNIGSDDFDSDFVNGSVAGITVTSGSVVSNIGGGMYRKGHIGDFVWSDDNFDGLQDLDERGLSGIQLLLEGIDGSGASVTMSTETNDNGSYIFSQLVPGVYTVRLVLPAGYVFTVYNNADTTINSDGIQGVADHIMVCSNENRQDIDFGLVKSLIVGDFVWDDLNANGIQNVGEPGISNVNIRLSGTTFDGTSVMRSTNTDINGKYEFGGVFPGSYSLQIEIPTDYTPTLVMAGNDRSLDSDLSETLTNIDFTLVADDLTLDIGLVKLGSIGDLVWEDLNCNGIREPNEPGIANVTVLLEGIDMFNVFVQLTTVTDANGNYIFNGLKPGQYTVNFVAPSGYEFSQAMMNNVILVSGQQVTNVDAPLFRRAALGDFVWFDSNENGIQDSGELGIAGVLVTLTGNTFTGQVNRDTLTDASGYYYFDNLKPGEYQIQVELPDNYRFTAINAGNDRTKDSDVNGNGIKSDIQLISGEINTDIDAGIILVASAFIGDYVWEDLNFNGIQDANEEGISGIEVLLTGTTLSGNNISLSVFTDDNGYYGFEDLEAGIYTVQFITVEPYLFTKQVAGNEDINSDADPVTGLTLPVTLGAITRVDNIDAGLYRRAFIGDFVWHDTNKNGLQDIGEPGIQGISINLLDAQDNIISTTTSLFNGLYFFVNLDPGDYRLEAEVPAQFLPTVQSNVSVTTNSDFSLQNGRVVTDLFSITSNGNRLDLDLGFIDAVSSISGYTWSDENGNGLKETNEAIKSGKLVYLLSIGGDTLAIDTTALNGFYTFENLNPGEYRIAFEVIQDSLFTYLNVGSDRSIDNDADKFTGRTFQIILLGGQALSGINAGYVGYSAIGDFVWRDDNEDGLQSPNEPGINGIKVVLLDRNGMVVDSTSTSLLSGSMLGGYYKFDRLPYDDYSVRFILRENLNYTVNVSGQDDINSDVVNLADGSTAIFVLRPNEYKDDIDAGYILTAPVTGSITGLVWQDANNNKVKDLDELVLEGVTVSLFDLGGNLVKTTVSDQGGIYLFDDVAFGDYYIMTEVLNDFVFVKFSGQSVPFDSDITNDFGPGSTGIITVFPGETIDDIDLGYARKISIGDFVWDDLNHNGLQDSGEPGLPSIPIRLINESSQVEATTVSDANGRYIFTDVAVGSYTIEFGLPQGYLHTINNLSNPSINSKADAQTGRTALIDFSLPQSYDDIDAGFVMHGSIGDRVWLDLNGNGIYQSSEPGISDIRVSLFTAAGTKVDETVTGTSPDGNFVGYYTFEKVRPGSYYVQFDIPSTYLISQPNVGDENTDSDINNANGPNTTSTFVVLVGQQLDNIDAGAYLPATLGDFVWDDLNMDGTQDIDEPGVPDIVVKLFTQTGQLLDTKVTDAEGKYAFTGLRQRLYYIQFELPDGYQFTQQYNSSSGATDSDVDATGTTPLISLAHGSNFLDVDAGIHITPSKIIMGTVWDDKNEDGIRTPDEKFQNNVLVQLKNKQNQIVKTFTTNHAGMYCVSTDDPGEHYVQVVSPISYLFTLKNAGNDRAMDSDVDENGTSDMKMLDDNYEMEYVDAGMYFKLTGNIKGRVWIDGNGNGVRDPHEATKANVVVFLFNRNRVFIKSVKTNESGLYSLNNIESGQYYCLIPEFPDLDFVMFTGQNQDIDSEITNQYGLGTSRLITIAGGSTEENFDFGYRPKNGFNKPAELATDEITVYPNPTLGNINVELPEGVTVADYFIVNNMGGTVLTGKLVNGQTTVNTDKLVSGRYTVHVVTDHSKWVKSFMKIID